MAKSSIGFTNWPFPKGERAKLIKISKPYAEDGKWYVKAKYLSAVTNKAVFIKHFFGDLHLLIVGAEYMDGTRQDIPNWKTTDIQLSAKWLSNKQYKPYLIKDKQKNEFDYYTFGIGIHNQYYIVPLAEIVRAILAPDVFWLNQVTLLDSIDTCVLYDYDGEVLNLNFSTDVPVRYRCLSI